MSHRRRHQGRPQRQGIIFIIALAVTTILAALLLVFAREMRTETAVSADQYAQARASAVEMGAEQWVLSQCETYTTPLSGNNQPQSNVGFGNTDITAIPAAAIPVGDPAHGGGYFWCLSFNPDNDQIYQYGIEDEGAKLNVNAATSAQLQLLPGMSQNQAACDSIVDWVDTDENVTGSDGAESSYYAGLAEPYASKNSNMDTVDELMLVKGITPAMLYGMDLNRDGVVDQTEQTVAAAAAPPTNANGVNDRRGIFNYLTCYTTRSVPGQFGAAPARPGQVVQKTIGLINLNTAPMAVLMTLPGLSQTDAQTIASQRAQTNTSAPSSSLTWAQSALGAGKWQSIYPYVTANSYQYSADIVAVSGDGRAFKRIRIVVDVRTQPGKIVYHKDLSDLGWPLPPDVRTSLRAGQGLPADATAEQQTPPDLTTPQS